MNPTWILIGLLGIILVCLGVIGFSLVMMQGNPKEDGKIMVLIFAIPIQILVLVVQYLS